MGPSTTILPATGRTRRDGARRALHSQIERRRREKINDRLIALRNTVPSCALLMAHRLNHQVPLAGPLAARYANAPPPKLSNDDEVETGQTTSRSRRRGPPPPPPNYDEELGLHKLDVLSATVGTFQSNLGTVMTRADLPSSFQTTLPSFMRTSTRCWPSAQPQALV